MKYSSKIATKIKDLFNKQIDAQVDKGFNTYGQTLDDCKDYEYNWELMTIQELIDALQYQVKQNIILKNAIVHHANVNGYKTVIADVAIERLRQNSLYGALDQSFEERYVALGEEFGELGQAIQVGKPWSKATDADDKYKEAIHVAAVAVSIAEKARKERLV